MNILRVAGRMFFPGTTIGSAGWRPAKRQQRRPAEKMKRGGGCPHGRRNPRRNIFASAGGTVFSHVFQREVFWAERRGDTSGLCSG